MSMGWQPNPAAEIGADGPLGATDVQEALDLIAAAGPFFTTESNPAYVLGLHPAYSTLKTFTIDNSTTRHLNATVDFAGGTLVTPIPITVAIRAVARRNAAGTVTVSSPSVVIVGTLSQFGVNWAVSGGSVVLQFKANGGPTMRSTLRYNWLQMVPS